MDNKIMLINMRNGFNIYLKIVNIIDLDTFDWGCYIDTRISFQRDRNLC